MINFKTRKVKSEMIMNSPIKIEPMPNPDFSSFYTENFSFGFEEDEFSMSNYLYHEKLFENIDTTN